MKKRTKKLKNYGYKADASKKENYVFGSILSPVPFEELMPSGQWDEFLPSAEFQSLNGVETQACVSFGVNSALEILIKKLYNI